MFTGRDENLVAGDLVVPIRLGLGLAAQQAQIGAAMGFSQAHRAGPFAAGQTRQIGRLLLSRAMRMQGLISAMAQARIHRPCLVGRVHHFVERLVKHHRQALASVLGVATHRRPTAFDIFGVGRLETLRRRHLMGGLVEHTAFGIAAQIQRQQHFGSEFAALLEHCIDHVRVNLGMFRALLQFIDNVEHLVHHELHVAQWRLVLGHVLLLSMRGDVDRLLAVTVTGFLAKASAARPAGVA